jgi:hypothetical protein
MDTIQIFKKTLGLVWRYRALWLFGFLMALTVNSTLWYGFGLDNQEAVVENRILLPNTSTINFPGQGLTIDLRSGEGPVVKIDNLGPGWVQDRLDEVTLNDLWALLISIGVVVLLGSLLSILFRYTSEAALIRMVDENERHDKMVSVRRGFRLGWSRVAGKLFLIDLCLNLPVALVFGLLFFLASSPLFLLGKNGFAESVARILGLSLLVLGGWVFLICLAVVVVVALSIIRPVMHQACGVDGLSVGASIRQGFGLLKIQPGKVILTWLVWLAVRLVWTIALLPVMIILSPLMLLTIPAGIVIGAVPALLAAGIASQFVSPIFAWILGALFGFPLFFLVTFAPLFFLSGLVEVFKSGFWTLSYREFRPLASAVSQPADQPGEAKLEAAIAA